MGRGDVFINTVGDRDLLSKVLDAASRFEHRPDDAAMRELMEARSATFIFGIAT